MMMTMMVRLMSMTLMRAQWSRLRRRPWQFIVVMMLWWFRRQRRWIWSKVLPTILPSGTVWEFELGRLHTGQEQSRLQATCYPEKILQNVSNNQRQDLAGNARGPLLGDWQVDVPSIPIFELRNGGSLADPHPLWTCLARNELPVANIIFHTISCVLVVDKKQ